MVEYSTKQKLAGMYVWVFKLDVSKTCAVDSNKIAPLTAKRGPNQADEEGITEEIVDHGDNGEAKSSIWLDYSTGST